MDTNDILHILRNPFGFSEQEVRTARYAAADLIEDLEKQRSVYRRDRVEGEREAQDIILEAAEKIKKL